MLQTVDTASLPGLTLKRFKQERLSAAERTVGSRRTVCLGGERNDMTTSASWQRARAVVGRGERAGADHPIGIGERVSVDAAAWPAGPRPAQLLGRRAVLGYFAGGALGVAAAASGLRTVRAGGDGRSRPAGAAPGVATPGVSVVRPHGIELAWRAEERPVLARNLRRVAP